MVQHEETNFSNRTFRYWDRDLEPFNPVRWLFRFSTIPGVGIQSKDTGEWSTSEDSKDILSQATHEVSFSNLVINTQAVSVGGGYSIKIPKDQQVGDVTIKFLESSVKNPASDFIKLWRSSVMNRKTGVYYPPREYKTEATLTVFSPATDKDQIVKFVGMFPLGIGDLSYDYNSPSKPLILSVTFSCDDVIYNDPSPEADYIGVPPQFTWGGVDAQGNPILSETNVTIQ